MKIQGFKLVTTQSEIVWSGRKGRAVFTVSIMEFLNGKVVHETQYFADPFEAPAWRTKWVQQTTKPSNIT